jgi:hypothetical protein
LHLVTSSNIIFERMLELLLTGVISPSLSLLMLNKHEKAEKQRQYHMKKIQKMEILIFPLSREAEVPCSGNMPEEAGMVVSKKIETVGRMQSLALTPPKKGIFGPHNWRRYHKRRCLASIRWRRHLLPLPPRQ